MTILLAFSILFLVPEEEVVQKKQEDLYPEEQYRELVTAGVYYGRKKTKTHPRMRSSILTTRNGIEIINLTKTLDMLGAALTVLGEKVRSGGTVLVVATQPAAEGAIELAKEFGFPSVRTRWLGGTLTNFKIISKRIEYFTQLKNDWAKNAFDQYTKKERLEIEREIARLEEFFGTLVSMTSLPSILLVIDANLHLTAVREARILGIPVVGYVNTDTDPDLLSHPVLANNKAKSSISWFLGKVRETISEAKQSAQAAVEASHLTAGDTVEDSKTGTREEKAETGAKAEPLQVSN